MQMKNLSRHLAGFALVAMPLLSNADAVGSLKDKLDQLQSLSGEFQQTLSDKAGVVVQESSGEFHLLRPNYFLWQSEAPYAQTVLGTPDKVWVYDPDLEQVTIQSRTPEQKNNPASLLAGNAEQIRDTFEVSASSSDGVTTYRLIPTTDESSYTRVDFVFADDALQSLAFADKLEQTTHITFAELDHNTQLSEDFFTFTPPEGTDVIVDE